MTFIMFLMGISFLMHAYIYFSLRIRMENMLVSLRDLHMTKIRIKREKAPVKRRKRIHEQLSI